MPTLTLTDRCNADAIRKPGELRLTGSITSIGGDTIYLDGQPALYRVDPVGLGDVHWELDKRRMGPDSPVAFRRFTHIEVEP